MDNEYPTYGRIYEFWFYISEIEYPFLLVSWFCDWTLSTFLGFPFSYHNRTDNGGIHFYSNNHVLNGVFQ